MAFVATSYAARPSPGRGRCGYCRRRVRLRYLERGGVVRVSGFHYDGHAGVCRGVGHLAWDDNGRLTGSDNPAPAGSGEAGKAKNQGASQ